MQPDSIIPDQTNPQSWNRYSYVTNSPLSYVDSSGHFGVPVLLGAVFLGVVIAAVIIVHDIATTPPTPTQRSPLPEKRDITQWLADRLNENATAPVTKALKDNWNSGSLTDKAGALKAWTGLVTTGGVWDYKKDIIKSRVIEPGVPNVAIGNQAHINYQAAANITYGYTAQQIGLPKWLAELGAGAAQMLSGHRGSIRYWGDDPFDNYMIQYGYDLAEKNKSKTGKLTKDDITNSFDEYINEHGDPGKPYDPGY